MDRASFPRKQDDFEQSVSAHMKAKPVRVSKFEHDGQSYWVKRTETNLGVRRVFKLRPAHAFERELKIYDDLAARGLPVPGIVLRGEGFAVFQDGGVTVESFWRKQSTDAGLRRAASVAAIEALGRMHSQGISHGRPVARDILWDGTRITFVDFENYSAKRNTLSGHAFDLLCLMHSLCAQPVQDRDLIDELGQIYRSQDALGVWGEAKRLVARYGWLEVLTRPIQARKPPHAREFKSLRIVRNMFSD